MGAPLRPSPPKKRANRKTPRRLLSQASRRPAPWAIPRRWLNSAIALFLLPIGFLLTVTFFDSFTGAALHSAFWASEEFWFFSLGAILWTLWFFGSIWTLHEPRPLRLYIFGHELTHAVWVWLMGGRVREFRVTREGGHIVTDTHNFWIALSPYFYPIYSIAVVAVYGVLNLFYNLASPASELLGVTALQWLFLAIGTTWAFHLSFTCWMIPKGQSDLTVHGTFFSTVVIYIMNLVVLTFLLILAGGVSCASFARQLLDNAGLFSEALWRAFAP